MFIIHNSIKAKMKDKHGIANPLDMVRRAFEAFSGLALIDKREVHKNLVDEPTKWFITEVGGWLYKVVYINYKNDIIIKTMYPVKADSPCVALYRHKTAKHLKKTSKGNKK